MHTIVAMNEDRIVRVLCRSCKKEHAFRHSPDRSSPPGRKPPAGRSAPAKTLSDAEEWRMEMGRLRGSSAKPYALDGQFEEGQKVVHRTFGTGVVKRLISGDKMEVLFEEGPKVLVRGRAKPR
jgi:hypothetical protein